MKKLLALLLAACMASTALAGCGSKEDTVDDTQETADVTEDASGEQETPAEDVTIVWYFMGDDHERNEVIFEKANEMVQEALGYNLDIRTIPSGDYEEKIKMVINSGEEYDICWASNWRNNYVQNVTNEAFLALDEYLEDTPALVDAIPETLWESSKVQGSIYGVTCQQVVARATTAAIPTIYADLYDSTVGTVETYADWEPYIAAIAEENPEAAVVQIDWQDLVYLYEIEALLGTNVPGAVTLSDEGKIEVFNQFDTDAFKDAVRVRREWNEKGYTLQGLASTEKNQWNEWERPMEISTYQPGSETYTGYQGFEVTQRKVSEAYVTTGGVTSTMMCVNVNSEHPAEAVKFLEYANTTPEFMNLLTYGIENEDFEYTEEGKVVRIDGMYKNDAWRIGNTFIVDLMDGQADDAIEQTAELNATAKASRVAGFTPDTTNIQLEITNCQSVVTEYMESFNEGIVGDVDTLLEEMNKKLETAGVQTIIDEIQSQIDAWLAVK